MKNLKQIIKEEILKVLQELTPSTSSLPKTLRTLASDLDKSSGGIQGGEILGLTELIPLMIEKAKAGSLDDTKIKSIKNILNQITTPKTTTSQPSTTTKM
jgi:hypothetical protein